MKIYKLFIGILFIYLFPLISFAAIEVEGSLRHIHSGMRGDVYKGEIRLHNSDEFEHEVKIYQTDLQYNYKDFTFYEEPVTHKRSNAKWIQFSPKTLIVKGNETTYIQYEVTIPKGDTIFGSYWSVLMIEGVIPIDLTKPGQLNISTVTRYAVQIVTEIADRGKDDLKISEPTIINEGDKVFLAIDIENIGDNYISPDVSIELFDESGKSVKTLKAPKKGLFPTTSARFRFSLEDIEGKKTYQVLIIAAGQDKSVFGLEYTLYL